MNANRNENLENTNQMKLSFSSDRGFAQERAHNARSSIDIVRQRPDFLGWSDIGGLEKNTFKENHKEG